MKPILRGLVVGLFVGLVLFGCATNYQVADPGCGYLDLPLGGEKFRIDVCGNSNTPRKRVQDIAMVRAAHLAVAAGFDRFRVLEASTEDHVLGALMNVQGIATYTTNYGIVLVVELTNDPDGVLAADILQLLGPEVGYPGTE